MELAGPFSVVAAIVAAEASAFALSRIPTSPFLWYLNIEILRPVSYGFSGLSAVMPLNPLELTDYLAAILLLLGSIGFIAKSRLAIAIASNLSLLYGFCLLYGSYQANSALQFNPDVLLRPSSVIAGGILATAAFSSIMSHRNYWNEMQAQE
jgi:hypothetical protein